MMYQFNIVFGILIAFLSNYFYRELGGDNDWRWMLEYWLYLLLFIPMVMSVPESPRWLISRKNDYKGAKDIATIGC